MLKNQISALLRAHVKDHLSPSPTERRFVTEVYKSVEAVLGERDCVQIGSYPRFTAITPLHDLDVLYTLGDWSAEANPAKALSDLEALLNQNYENPTKHSLRISTQTHSITISFFEAGEEVFGVDIVPAYKSGSNEFGDSMFMVPEIVRKSHSSRKPFMEQLIRDGQNMTWIPSDPRGYISAATVLNANNSDFRRTVKFIKAWRGSCKSDDPDFPLKSFHIEQVITRFFNSTDNVDIFDGVFDFFTNLPNSITWPNIPDRANLDRNVDAYVDGISAPQRQKILQARDHFLITLENLQNGDSAEELTNVGYRKRVSDTEKFLFDSQIPVFCEGEFKVVGNVLPREGGFRARILDALGLIEVDRKINFRVGPDAPQADVYKWKVKNDDNSPQPRGELSDHGTLNDPEHTKYKGKHYVECFAIKNGNCIARSRQNVILGMRE